MILEMKKGISTIKQEGGGEWLDEKNETSFEKVESIQIKIMKSQKK